MLEKIKDFVIANIKQYNNKIIIDDVKEYGSKKLELVLTTKKYMASISILSDFTFDFLAVEIISEEIVINSTESCNSIKDLYTRIDKHISRFSSL